jgi:hypothetical protein
MEKGLSADHPDVVDEGVDALVILASERLAQDPTRRSLVSRSIRERHPASSREIADALGVDHETINRALRGANVPAQEEKQSKNNDHSGANAPVVPLCEPNSSRVIARSKVRHEPPPIGDRTSTSGHV